MRIELVQAAPRRRELEAAEGGRDIATAELGKIVAWPPGHL